MKKNHKSKLIKELQKTNKQNVSEKKRLLQQYFNQDIQGAFYDDELGILCGQRDQLLRLVNHAIAVFKTHNREACYDVMYTNILALCLEYSADYEACFMKIYAEYLQEVPEADLRKIKKLIAKGRQLTPTELIVARTISVAIILEIRETDFMDYAGCLVYLEYLNEQLLEGVQEKKISYLRLLTGEGNRLVAFDLHYGKEPYSQDELKDPQTNFYIKWDTLADFEQAFAIAKRTYPLFETKSHNQITPLIVYKKEYNSQLKAEDILYSVMSVYERELTTALGETDSEIPASFFAKIDLFLTKYPPEKTADIANQKALFHQVRVIRNDIYHGTAVSEPESKLELLEQVLIIISNSRLKNND